MEHPKFAELEARIEALEEALKIKQDTPKKAPAKKG